MNRCSWVNMNNELYIKYHDEEWGRKSFNDNHLFEMLLLESFQAGLSWECILNKRENFRAAFDNFNIDKIINYDEEKINMLLNNKGIIRNKLKIIAAINNAKIFNKIQKELEKVVPLESVITKARQLENIHNLIKNNGKNFNLTQEELELANKLV